MLTIDIIRYRFDVTVFFSWFIYTFNFVLFSRGKKLAFMSYYLSPEARLLVTHTVRNTTNSIVLELISSDFNILSRSHFTIVPAFQERFGWGFTNIIRAAICSTVSLYTAVCFSHHPSTTLSTFALRPICCCLSSW